MISHNPLVTISIPAYNCSHFIQACLRSIYVQTYKNYEIIIVDDCSTDRSIELIHRVINFYKLRDKTKLFTHSINCGCGMTEKHAIEFGSGELVVILDSDDALSSEKALEILVKAHKKNPDASLVYSDFYNCDEKLKPQKLRNASVSHVKCFKRSFYNKTEGVNPNLLKAVDKDLITKLQSVGKTVHVPLPLYFHRVHRHSLSSKFKREPNLDTTTSQKISVPSRLKIFDESTERHIVVERMEPYFNSKGCFVLSNPRNCDVQLSFARIEKSNNLPTVLRIDGIYYDLDTNYKAKNLSISNSHERSDGVIYQSNYSKALCEKFLKPRKRTSICKVIYNGVDPKWCGERKDHLGTNIVILSKWRRLKRLKEIVNLFLEFLNVVPDSTLHVLGELHGNKPVKHEKIIYYGMVSRDIVGNVLNIADFSLHLCKRDSCPNSVVETIGAGVPVITTDKCGGATEICSVTQGCIVCNGDFDSDFKPEHPYRDSYNILTPQLHDNILQSMIMISKDKRLVKLPEQLTAEYMANSYIDIMEKVK